MPTGVQIEVTMVSLLKKRGKDRRYIITQEPDREPGPITVTVRATYIRDGTPGISLSMGERNLGEWTDSKVESLVLEQDYGISVRGKEKEPRYRITLPGTPLSGEQVSEREVTVTLYI